MKTDTTPPKISPGYECNARRFRDGEFRGYCSNRAGKGTDHVGEGRCSFHGGKAGAPTGSANGRYVHGAYSSRLLEDLTPEEEEAIEDLKRCLSGPDGSIEVAGGLVGEAAMKYKRSEDVRFLREMRQLLSAFFQLDGSGDWRAR